MNFVRQNINSPFIHNKNKNMNKPAKSRGRMEIRGKGKPIFCGSGGEWKV
jgi:hypothetical protein